MYSSRFIKSVLAGVAMGASVSAGAATITFDHGVDGNGVATTNVDSATVVDFNDGTCAGYGACIENFDIRGEGTSSGGLYAAPPSLGGGNNTQFFINPEELSADNTARAFLPDRTANYFGLLWGTIDASNSISFLNGFESSEDVLFTLTGAEVIAEAQRQNYSLTENNGSAYVNLFNLPDYNTIRFDSQGTAFESDNHAYATLDDEAVADVPEPSSLALFALGLVSLGGLARRRGLI